MKNITTHILKIALLLIAFESIASKVRAELEATNKITQPEQVDNNQEQQQFQDDDIPTSYFEQDSISNKFNQKLSFDQYITYSIKALKLVAGYDNDLHRYDSQRDLIDSFARNLSYADDLSNRKPLVHINERNLLNDAAELTLINNEQNQKICGKHLEFLLEESRKLFANSQAFSSSKQLNLIEFFDSFGGPTPQLMKGNVMWLGSVDQCQQSSLTIPNHHHHEHDNPSKDIILGRYCIAKFENGNWTSLGKESSESRSIKVGVCLPGSCNSLSQLRYSDKIEKLVQQVRLSQVPFKDYKLAHLYCLPDERSPLRQFSRSAMLFICFISSWLTIVAYVSIKYEIRRMFKGLNSTELAYPSKLERIFCLRCSWAILFQKNVTNNMLKASNLCLNVKNLELPLKEGSVVHLNPQKSTTSNQPESNQISQLPTNKIDLSVIDGLKVLSMIWLIIGHVMIFFVRHIANGRDFWTIIKDYKYLPIIGGIYPVDSFFTITGILTTYLKFYKQDGQAMRKISYWLEAFVHRYLRFMPMYLLIFWYIRDVSQYIGSGPLWDYGTAETSFRGICKGESMAVPLLFQANYKPLHEHCVKPAWYLANDYQFLLITPIYMALMIYNRLLGYCAIFLSILLSLASQIMTVYYSNQIDDFSTLINYKPMFATYVLINLWKLYALPLNRITPYLVGLFTGHLLYETERFNSKRKQVEDLQNDSISNESSLSTSNPSSKQALNKEHEKDGSKSCLATLSDYICTKIWLPLIVLSFVIYTPVLARIFYYEKESFSAKIQSSSVLAFLRLVWSLSIARLIYICATRNLDKQNSHNNIIIRLLTSPTWKPWSRIGFSALLIQWEIIGYLAQTQTSLPNMTIPFILSNALLSIFGTYLLALFLYLTFEYPMSQIETLYIHPFLFNKL